MKNAPFLTLCALFFATAAPACADTVAVHGSTTFVAALFDAHKADIEKESGLSLDVVGNGSGNGLADLAAGKADLAMISSNLDTIVAKLNAKTPGSVDGTALKAVEVSKTHIAFIVNPANPVKALTDAQLSAILTAKITNWKEVGGEDKAIVVATEIPGGGLRASVEKEMLGGTAIAATKRELVNASLITKMVAQLPDALGIVGAAAVTSTVRELSLDKVDPITLSYVTKGTPTANAQKVIDATLKFAK